MVLQCKIPDKRFISLQIAFCTTSESLFPVDFFSFYLFRKENNNVIKIMINF